MLRLTQLIYLMLPVYFSNMAPPFVKYWPGWNRPISRRWLGDHKTVVGFVLGVAVATMTAFAQSLIARTGFHCLAVTRCLSRVPICHLSGGATSLGVRRITVVFGVRFSRDLVI